jgi:MFS family permease
LPILLGSLPLFILAFLLPIYAQELGASAADIGGLFAVFSLVMIVIRPLVGMAMDRYGRRYFLLAGLSVYVLSMGVFTVAETLAALYVARMIQGVGATLTWIATYTIAAELALAERRGEAIGQADGAGERGAVYGAAMAMALLAWVPLPEGWKVVFAAYTLCAILAVWLAWRRVPETRSSEPSQRPPARLSQASFAAKLLAFFRPAASSSGPASASLSRLLVNVFCTKLSQSLVNLMLLIFLRDQFSLELWQLALAYLPAVLILGFLPAPMGRVSDRIGRIAPIVAGLFISALTSLLMPGLIHLGWFMLVFALNAFGIVMATPAQKAMVGDLTQRQNWGQAFALYTFTASLGTAAGPLLGGWLYDYAGPAVPFYANAALLILSALWGLVGLHGHRRRPRMSPLTPRYGLTRAFRSVLALMHKRHQTETASPTPVSSVESAP